MRLISLFSLSSSSLASSSSSFRQSTFFCKFAAEAFEWVSAQNLIEMAERFYEIQTSST